MNKVYQWREIGESDWEACYTLMTFEWYEESPEHDTRIVWSINAV